MNIEKSDPRLTAHALGELTGEEKAELQKSADAVRSTQAVVDAG